MYGRYGMDKLNGTLGTIWFIVSKVAENIFIPFTVGGGIRTVEDFTQILRAGADKVSVNSAAIKNPDLINEAAYKFGSQCVVTAIDAKRNGKSWEVYINGGRIPMGIDAVKWAVTVRRIPDGNGSLKIPHMGWNSLNIRKNDGLFKGIAPNPYVYFVHSYFLKADDDNIVSSQTEYGTIIDSSVQYQNIMATQFHPEKSGKVGLQMLQNFAEMCR